MCFKTSKKIIKILYNKNFIKKEKNQKRKFDPDLNSEGGKMHEQKIYTKFHQIIQMRNSLKNADFKGEEAKRYLGIFNFCLNSLKDEYQLILKKSYLEYSYQFWWLDYFCKSSYYRKRYWAILAFVRLFEMIYENFNDHSAYLNYIR